MTNKVSVCFRSMRLNKKSLIQYLAREYYFSLVRIALIRTGRTVCSCAKRTHARTMQLIRPNRQTSTSLTQKKHRDTMHTRFAKRAANE